MLSFDNCVVSFTQGKDSLRTDQNLKQHEAQSARHVRRELPLATQVFVVVLVIHILSAN